MGLSMQPCPSPTGQSKNSVCLFPFLTHDIKDLYIWQQEPSDTFQTDHFDEECERVVDVEPKQKPLDPRSIYIVYHLFSIVFFFSQQNC